MTGSPPQRSSHTGTRTWAFSCCPPMTTTSSSGASSLTARPVAATSSKSGLTTSTTIRHALNLVQRRKTFSDTPFLDRLHRRQPVITELLTPRELDDLRLLAAGLSNAAIATQLRIKGDKVEYTTRSIYTKLDIPRTPDQNPRVHAAIRWLQEKPEDGRSAAT